MKRNGRVWIAEDDRSVTRIDAAQYGMLIDLHCPEGQHPLSVQLLQLISASSKAQHSLTWNITCIGVGTEKPRRKT